MSEAQFGLGLVLDLSHAGFAAVLDAEGMKVLARDSRPAGTRHEDAGEWTDALLRQAGGGFSDIGWICVGVGPGSFTGIRIAMAFAQGVALPRKVPLHGFTSFEALQLSFRGGRSLAVVPANSGRFYASGSLVDEGALLEAEAFKALTDATVTVLASSRTDALEQSCSGFAGLWVPKGEWDVVAIARHARSGGRSTERPVYLQLSAAEAAHDRLKAEQGSKAVRS